MEELFKKIQEYKRSVDGPFFCIISDAHAMTYLLKKVKAGDVLKDCFDAVWESIADTYASPSTYMEFVYVLAFANMHNVKIREEDRLAIRNTALHIFEDRDSADSRRKQSFSKE